MPVPAIEIDRTGLQLTHEGSLMVIEVIARSTDGKMYLLQNYVKDNPDMISGAYHVTYEQLEIMKVGHETGLWLEQIETVLP